jgi:heterodisulfide reductase subunit C
VPAEAGPARPWVETTEMTRPTDLRPAPSVAGELLRLRGTDVTPCTECGACSEVCPLRFAMDVPPAELMTRAKRGAGEELLPYGAPWVCTDCRRCSLVCPVSIDVARAMEGLRLLAQEKGRAPQGHSVVEFHRLFVEGVARRGRIHELALLWRLRRSVPSWPGRLGLVAVLLGRGKLPLRPERLRGWSEVDGRTVVGGDGGGTEVAGRPPGGPEPEGEHP